jgi:predicted dehydrogenase
MLRLGFIGLGAMGMTHVNTIAELCREEATVAAVCSTQPERVAQVLKTSPGATVFTEPSGLIQAPLDAVFVATPNFTHVPLALQVLAAGKHLYLEKPLGITAAECQALAQAAEKSNRIALVGHEFRHSPYFRKIKELLQAGEIGRPRMVWCREFRGPFQKKSADWIQHNSRSGGMLVEKNCHHFDLMTWWVEGRPRRVCAFGGCAMNRRFDGPDQTNDHATVSFEYDNSVRGTLQVCLFARDFPQEDLELGLVGETGELRTSLSAREILHWPRGAAGQDPIVHQVPSPAGLGWGSHLGMDEIHREFVRCILEQRAPVTSVKNCLDGTLLAIAAEESARTGKLVELEPPSAHAK